MERLVTAVVKKDNGKIVHIVNHNKEVYFKVYKEQDFLKDQVAITNNVLDLNRSSYTRFRSYSELIMMFVELPRYAELMMPSVKHEHEDSRGHRIIITDDFTILSDNITYAVVSNALLFKHDYGTPAVPEIEDIKDLLFTYKTMHEPYHLEFHLGSNIIFIKGDVLDKVIYKG